MVYGRVVYVKSEEKNPFTLVTVKGNGDGKRHVVPVPNEVYEKAVDKNKGTLWENEIEIETVEIKGKTSMVIRVFH